MKVSIIIPCKELNNYVEECIEHCKKLEYSNFEIILIPDKKIKQIDGVKIIIKERKPSAKRNFAAKRANGEILAFIDSDAYPDKEWLKNALKQFKSEIGIVGGPNLTPKDDSFTQKISGEILSNKLMGNASIRYRIDRLKEVNELPSCNFLVKNDLFLKLKGFDENLLTAEDSKLCFEIKEKLNKKVLYAPDVIVYHHRRKGFFNHLKQMFIYGRDVAYLFKKDKFRIYYMIPSLLVLYIVLGLITSFLIRQFSIFFLITIFIYIMIILIFSFRLNIIKWVLISIGVILTHLIYGLGFLYGVKNENINRLSTIKG